MTEWIAVILLVVGVAPLLVLKLWARRRWEAERRNDTSNDR